MCGQLPPNQRRSTTATDAPSSRALNAAASPAGPAPMIDEVEPVHASPPLARLGQAALAPRLVQQDRGGDRHVEAVGDAEHRQADGLDVGARPRARSDRPPPRRGRSRAARSGRRRCRAARRRRGPRRSGCPRSRSQARTSPVGAAASGTAKTVPALARITFGLKRSGPRRRRDDGVDAGAIGAAQDRAEVARLLDALDHDDERIVRQAQRRRAPSDGIADDGDEAFGALAERELREDRLGRRRIGVPRSRRRSSAARASGPASSGSHTNASTTSTPASSARRSSRAPSTSVRPVRSRSRRSRRAARPGPAGSRCW